MAFERFIDTFSSVNNANFGRGKRKSIGKRGLRKVKTNNITGHGKAISFMN